MASQNPPKKEDQGKDAQKQGATDACVTELCASLQETMAQGETSGPGEQCDRNSGLQGSRLLLAGLPLPMEYAIENHTVY